jgi:UDP-glucose 4-epimerase
MRAANLGVGRGYSVREVIDAVRRVTGRELPIRIAPRRPGDPPALIADASPASTLPDWSARWTELEAIIDTAWRWHRRHFGDGA